MAPTTPGSALATTATAGLSLQIQSPDDLQRLARLFSASGLFGRAAGNDPNAHMAECAIKILAGMEAGFGSFASIAGVSVINGRPGFGANLLAQAIKRHPLYDYRVLEKTDQVCRIKFLAGKEELGVETFTIAMAERAGLIKNGGPWRQYPEAMLFARCLSAGMRTHCPDALGGAPAYTPEELGAQGQIDENGVVVEDVTEEPPARDQLQARALRRLKDSGLTAAGTQQMLSELAGPGATGFGQLSDDVLGRLARVGATAETIARWNAAAALGPQRTITVLDADSDPMDVPAGPEGEDPDDLPLAWTTPEPATA